MECARNSKSRDDALGVCQEFKVKRGCTIECQEFKVEMLAIEGTLGMFQEFKV